jgi:hypothetical protein
MHLYNQNGLFCSLVHDFSFFDAEDGGNTFLRHVAEFLQDYTVSHPRRLYVYHFCSKQGAVVKAPATRTP